MTSLTFATTFSTVKPKCFMTAGPGADHFNGLMLSTNDVVAVMRRDVMRPVTSHPPSW